MTTGNDGIAQTASGPVRPTVGPTGSRVPSAVAQKVCGDCALHIVTYRHDIEVPGNEYEGTCSAPRWAKLPVNRWHDDPYASKCKAFAEKGRPIVGRNFF